MSYVHFIVTTAIALMVASSCMAQDTTSPYPREVYTSNHLVVVQLAERSWQHISYKQTNDFGNVPCNGLVVRSADQVVVFDTPTTDSSANELITWINKALRCSIVAVVPTHFHDDCLGGLRAFHDQGIPSHGNQATIDLARSAGTAVPQRAFRDSLRLRLGSDFVQVLFLGEGHTRDNVVGYFGPDAVLFGGCLIKEVDASKGYLADANVDAWSSTVQRVRAAFPNARIVIPGHGEPGGTELLDYTIELFRSR